MRTVTLTYPVPPGNAEGIPQQPQIAALGQFDGLHRGHASVITAAVSKAREEGVPAAVITFYPHPKDVMGKGDYEGYLTPPADKAQLLDEMGVDIMYVIEFNDQLSKVSPEEFVANMLRPLNISMAVVGFDFHFGYKGEGDADKLRELGLDFMQVETVPPFQLNGEKVSSSGIRKALQTGAMELANLWFGRCYHLRGVVEHGEQRGRTIGFPTANLRLEDRYVIPAKGVYAVLAHLDGDVLPGVMNVGVKPTFHEGVTAPTFEVHLLHFSGDVYGREMTVELVEFIRPERKFDSIDALVSQIRLDAETAENLLKNKKV
ncbi:riboflavin biosynthesis protein RibF [Paenibacillus stellifer]|uniref:Riboflavin biosynthesis protein n=1 Tax=Paenibacillus stellifer TaxID=169760 RepID=A0A089LWC7_9BACL|nr:bifunctional riboflavin kinase/FAD synthetase [Paenibacillus stellifer]AIQ64405.1 riboflavin biosynthesis protein RibF [Paenibacillus stellifer]